MNLAPKNYIGNPSGQDGFAGWNILKSGGNEWAIERKPEGCDDLPTPDMVYFGWKDRSCFVTSYGACVKSYLVDILHEGLFATAMVSMLPMEIVCSQMYASRWDCGGKGSWHLTVLDENKKMLKEHKGKMEENYVGWKQIEHAFVFGTRDQRLVERIRYLEFTHEGTDLKTWSGHYGMKFARASVKVQPHKESPVSAPSLPVRRKPPIEKPKVHVEKAKAFNLQNDQLSCPICFELPRKEVYQCRNGHTICDECINSLTHCPQCREKYEGTRIRNRAVEFLLENVEMECCYKENGCGITTLKKKLPEHEKTCRFRMY